MQVFRKQTWRPALSLRGGVTVTPPLTFPQKSFRRGHVATRRLAAPSQAGVRPADARPRHQSRGPQPPKHRATAQNGLVILVVTDVWLRAEKEDDELTEYEASPAASMAKGLRSKYKKRLRTVKRGVVKKEMAQPATRVGAREVKKEGKLAEALSGHIAPSKLPRAHCARTPRAR